MAESIIRYCITIWGGLYKNSLYNLEVIQNSIIKIIFKKPKRYSTDLIYQETGLFSIKKMYAYQCVLWVHKYNVSNILSYTTQTRAVKEQSIQVPFFKKSHIQRFVFYYGPKIYNLLPLEIKNIKNHIRFKKELKVFINSNFNKIKNILYP